MSIVVLQSVIIEIRPADRVSVGVAKARGIAESLDRSWR